MPASDPISIYLGEDVEVALNMNPAQDTTGWTVRFEVFSSGAESLDKACSEVDVSQGMYKVPITAVESAALVHADSYAVWRTDTGASRLLALGAFEAKPATRL